MNRVLSAYIQGSHDSESSEQKEAQLAAAKEEQKLRMDKLKLDREQFDASLEQIKATARLAASKETREAAQAFFESGGKVTPGKKISETIEDDESVTQTFETPTGPQTLADPKNFHTSSENTRLSIAQTQAEIRRLSEESKNDRATEGRDLKRDLAELGFLRDQNKEAGVQGRFDSLQENLTNRFNINQANEDRRQAELFKQQVRLKTMEMQIQGIKADKEEMLTPKDVAMLQEQFPDAYVGMHVSELKGDKALKKLNDSERKVMRSIEIQEGLIERFKKIANPKLLQEYYAGKWKGGIDTGIAAIVGAPEQQAALRNITSELEAEMKKMQEYGANLAGNEIEQMRGFALSASRMSNVADIKAALEELPRYLSSTRAAIIGRAAGKNTNANNLLEAKDASDNANAEFEKYLLENKGR